MTEVDVKPELLRWAIERSGLSMDFLRSKLPKLEKWIAQEKKPTLKQLQDFAKRTMVPFGYLFLATPPVETLPMPDYRTRRDQGIRRPSPNLIDTIHEMERRQDWMREYLLEEGHEKLPFVGSKKVGDSIYETANAVRKTLGLDSNWAQRTGSTENALRLLRDQVEQIGILIFLNGVVGNNTTRPLSVEEFQGFVLSDEIVPLIFVNSVDSKNAQIFTIAHELVHVWIGKSAIFDSLATNETDEETEKFCNEVAAEFLVPRDLLTAALPPKRITNKDFRSLSKVFRVSPIVVARRSLELGLINSESFFSFYRGYMNELKNLPSQESTGGNFWNTQNTRLGKRFGLAVITAAKEGRLSYTEAYSLTNLPGQTFDRYASRLQKEMSR